MSDSDDSWLSDSHQPDDDALNLSENALCQRMLLEKGASETEPETVIYSAKLLKITTDGKKQKRIFLITDKAIYNLLPSNLGKCKLRISLKSIISITVSTITRLQFLVYKTKTDKFHRFQSTDKHNLIQKLRKAYVMCSQKALLLNKYALSIDHIIGAKAETVSAYTLICGYIRDSKIEQRLSNIVPQVIYDLILLFCDSFECFQTYNREVLTLNGTMKRTFTMTDCAHTTIYGAIKIASLNNKIIYQWRFKINKRTDSMAIGIDETKYKWKYTNFLRSQSEDEATHSFGMYSDGRIARNLCEEVYPRLRNTHKKVLQYQTNDTVDMILNLNDGTLSYSVNDGNQYKLFHGIKKAIDIEYCLAVYAYYKDNSISLLETRVYDYNTKRKCEV